MYYSTGRKRGKTSVLVVVQFLSTLTKGLVDNTDEKQPPFKRVACSPFNTVVSDTIIIRRAYFSLLIIYWQLYGSFTVVSRLPCFYGPIDACAKFPSPRTRGPGDEAKGEPCSMLILKSVAPHRSVALKRWVLVTEGRASRYNTYVSGTA